MEMSSMYDGYEGAQDNILGLGKNAAKKSAARKTKRAAKALKKGNTKKATKLTKKASTVLRKGTLVQRGVKKAGNVLKSVAGVSVLLPLQPLRPAMMKALKKKGVFVNKKTSLLDVTNRFYNSVVKASGNYDHYADIDTTELPDDHLAVAIPVIVEAIISFFKKSKQKKDAGEKLSPVEEVAAEGTEIATAKIEKTIKDEAAQEIGERVMQTNWPLIIGIAAGVVLLIVVVKK